MSRRPHNAPNQPSNDSSRRGRFLKPSAGTNGQGQFGDVVNQKFVRVGGEQLADVETHRDLSAANQRVEQAELKAAAAVRRATDSILAIRADAQQQIKQALAARDQLETKLVEQTRITELRIQELKATEAGHEDELQQLETALTAGLKQREEAAVETKMKQREASLQKEFKQREAALQKKSNQREAALEVKMRQQEAAHQLELARRETKHAERTRAKEREHESAIKTKDMLHTSIIQTHEAEFQLQQQLQEQQLQEQKLQQQQLQQRVKEQQLQQVKELGVALSAGTMKSNGATASTPAFASVPSQQPPKPAQDSEQAKNKRPRQRHLHKSSSFDLRTRKMLHQRKRWQQGQDLQVLEGGRSTDDWTAESWLESLRLTDVLAMTLRRGGDKKAQGDAAGAQDGGGGSGAKSDLGAAEFQLLATLSEKDVEDAVALAQSLLAEIIWEAVQELQENKLLAVDVRTISDKFSKFAKFVFSFGDLRDFREGLDERIGGPSEQVEAEMRREHSSYRYSTHEFTSHNYRVRTTPAKEWAFVVDGVPGPGEVREII
jgi:hypothetical protein